MSPKPRLKTGAATHPGRTAVENEDAHALFTARLRRGGLFGGSQPVQLAVVADGISGSRAGAAASRLTVESFRQYFQSKVGEDKPIWMRLNEAILHANAEIYRESLNDSSKRGMGATVVAAAIEEDILYIGHVGDSRAYLMRRGKTHQLTIDHTQVQELVAAGTLSPEAARVHPERFHLTRRLGRHDDIKADLSMVEVGNDENNAVKPHKVTSLRLERGDTLLLCSDGLPMELSEEVIHDIVSHTSPPQNAAQRLVEQANAVGGRDNITAVLVQWPNRRSGVGAFLFLALAALVAAFYLGLLPPVQDSVADSSDSAQLGIALAPAASTEPADAAAAGASPIPVVTVPAPAVTVVVPVQVVEETPVTAANRGSSVVSVNPLVTVLPTATLPPRATLAPSPTPLPVATPLPPPTPQAVVQPPAAAAQAPTAGRVTLISPEDGSQLSGPQTFSWQADFTPGPNQAFELIFWFPGQDPLSEGLGWGGISRSTQTGVDLDAAFISAGRYRWGVRLVQISPYEKLLFLGSERGITINKSSGGDDNSDERNTCFGC